MKCKCIKSNNCFIVGKEYEFESLLFKSCDYNFKVLNPDSSALISKVIFSKKDFKKLFIEIK